MQPIKITAWMGSAIAVYEDWSPAIDSVLEWLLLDSLGMTSPNPTSEQVERTRPIIDKHMPLQKGELCRTNPSSRTSSQELKGEWYWKASSPCYTIVAEETDKFRKRWDYQDTALSWGKRRARWDNSQGAEKSYDLPLYLRVTPCISWFVVGEIDAIASLLDSCKAIGKKRSHGHGQVLLWEVAKVAQDWHLYREGRLMRPVPVQCLGDYQDGALLRWGWRPPAWLHSNQELCVMPAIIQNAQSAI